MDELARRPPPSVPPRLVESRRERFGLLWFPTLSVDDASRTVLTAVAGLPHCPRCLCALAMTSARPGSAADMQAVPA